MKTNNRMKSFIFFLFLCISTVTLSQNCIVSANDLLEKRITVIEKYFTLLGQGHYKQIPALFTEDAMVSDPVRHVLKASKYYNELDTYLIDPHMTLYNIFVGLKNPNVLSAHFNMKIKPKNKLENRGEIADLFVFKDDSTKISKIYILGNQESLPFTID